MAISDWPSSERPRERLLTEGPSALSDAELLAIFLRTGIRGKSAVELARELLNHFGSLRQLLASDQASFCQVKGLGIAKYTQLKAVTEMARRHLAETLIRGDSLTSPKQAEEYLKTCLRDRPYEVFACLYLDNRHRGIHFEELFRGTLTSASVHPREVVKQALHYNAAAVIIAHNHPSGVAEPSAADQHLTQNLVAALKLVDVKVLDHFVVGDEFCVSFAQRGLI